jgi:hypothetical protein
MGNPIQDWLDKFNKPAQTVSGKAGVDTSGKPAAVGNAGVGARTAAPAPQVSDGFLQQNSLQQQKAAMALKTNQDIINAAYKVAEQLKLEGGPWPLLRAAGWGHLTDKRGDHYKGPAIDEIEKLTPEQKAALKRTLGL